MKHYVQKHLPPTAVPWRQGCIIWPALLLTLKLQHAVGLPACAMQCACYSQYFNKQYIIFHPHSFYDVFRTMWADNNFLKWSWAQAVISITESCLFLTQCRLRARRSRASSIGFQPCPLRTEISLRHFRVSYFWSVAPIGKMKTPLESLSQADVVYSF